MAYLFKILRFDPLKDKHPYFEEFSHEADKKDSILDALKDIRDRQDPSLAFRYSCREAICGSCSMGINGNILLACRTILESLDSHQIVIEPLPNFEIQKDLVVDMEPFWDALYAIKPYLLSDRKIPEKGYRIEEREMEKIYQFITCILCGSCYSACPVVSRDDRYLGPAALAKLYRFVKDPRDKRHFASWVHINHQSGAWGCDTVFKCNEVCPKDVRPADGIEALRRKLIAEKIKHFFKRKA